MLSVRMTTRLAALGDGSDYRSEIWAYIKANPGLTVKQLTDRYPASGPPGAVTRQVVRALWERGEITTSDGGKIDPKNRMSSLNKLVFHSPDLRDEYVGEAISAGVPKHKAVTIADWAVADAAERGMPHDWAQYNG